jgi:hypothetical protein
MNKLVVQITGVQLHREGNAVVVEVETGGVWLPIIREQIETPFSHICDSWCIKQAADKYGMVLPDRHT